MMRQMLSVTTVLLGWAVAQAADVGLTVGSQAPKFAVKKFIKGDPVKSLKKGKIYAIHFWATWTEGSDCDAGG